MKYFLLMLIIVISGCQSVPVELNPGALILLKDKPIVKVYPRVVSSGNWVEFGISLESSSERMLKVRDIKVVDKSNAGSIPISGYMWALNKWGYSKKSIIDYDGKRYLVRVESK